MRNDGEMIGFIFLAIAPLASFSLAPVTTAKQRVLAGLAALTRPVRERLPRTRQQRLHRYHVPDDFDYQRCTFSQYQGHNGSSSAFRSKYGSIRAGLDPGYHGTYSAERQALPMLTNDLARKTVALLAEGEW